MFNTVVILLVCKLLLAAAQQDTAAQIHTLPTECEGETTMTQPLPDNTGCVRCECVNGFWVCVEVYQPGVCCHEFNLEQFCPCKADEIVYQPTPNGDGCVECRCEDGFWVCIAMHDPKTCCQQFHLSKFCECDEDEIMMQVMPNNAGCVECHCIDGFWVCIAQHPPDVCCHQFHMEQFCDCTGNETQILPLPDNTGCYLCYCENGFWVCAIPTYDQQTCCKEFNLQIFCEVCCVKGTVRLNLKDSTSVSGAVEGISVSGEDITNPYCLQHNCKCASPALVKASFDDILPLTGCVAEPLCRKRMLRVDIKLHSSERYGFMFMIADNVDSNGFPVNYLPFRNRAELIANYPQLQLHKSDPCFNHPNIVINFGALISPGAKWITIFVSNYFIRIKQSPVFDSSYCSDCYYALNQQPDGSGNVEQTVYLSFNRVVNLGTTSNFGAGVCRVKMRWVCPCNKKDWREFIGIRDKFRVRKEKA